jgi:hypothetical protein
MGYQIWAASFSDDTWSSFTHVKFRNAVFCVMIPCSVVHAYRRFGGTYCLHNHIWRPRRYVPPKRLYPPNRVHGDVTQKTTELISSLILQTRSGMKNVVFWDVAPCRYCVNRRFWRMYRLHHHGRKIRERGASVSTWLQTTRWFLLRNDGSHKIYTA